MKKRFITLLFFILTLVFSLTAFSREAYLVYENFDDNIHAFAENNTNEDIAIKSIACVCSSEGIIKSLSVQSYGINKWNKLSITHKIPITVLKKAIM